MRSESTIYPNPQFTCKVPALPMAVSLASPAVPDATSIENVSLWLLHQVVSDNKRQALHSSGRAALGSVTEILTQGRCKLAIAVPPPTWLLQPDE